MPGKRAVRLPPRRRLTPTGPVDAVDRYHNPGIGWVLRRRLQWVADELPATPMSRLLEVGYGSGIFMHELAGRAAELYGIDVHALGGQVRTQLGRIGTPVMLAQGSGMALPFRDESFDAVVVVSALEFMDDPLQCMREMFRVVRAGGPVICVTPRILAWADNLYRMLVGFDPESEFRGGRHRVQHALDESQLPIERFLRPRGWPSALAPYEVVVMRQPTRPPASTRDKSGA